MGAASTAAFTAASLPMSGRAAPERTATATPERTATATPERTMSVRLPGSTWPLAMSLSMASEPSATASKGSPAATRLAASTPPTDSSATATPGCAR